MVKVEKDYFYENKYKKRREAVKFSRDTFEVPDKDRDSAGHKQQINEVIRKMVWS